MAAVCDICGKGPGFGKSVSHSHRRTSRRWNPNVQTVHVVTRPGGNKKRLNVCASCIKAGKVTRGGSAVDDGEFVVAGGQRAPLFEQGE